MSWLTTARTRLAQAKSRGQILMIYGMSAMAVMGFAGLAVDGGQIFTQRRLTQNGADTAALVAARDVANGAYASVSSHITTYTQGNAGPTATASWDYVDNSGNTVSQANATGVTVLVTKTFSTWFIQALNIPSFTVASRATARVQALSGLANVPFIVCSDGLKRNETFFTSGGVQGIVDYTTLPPSIREEALYANGGPEFYVHGGKVGQDNGDCSWNGGASSFKGNADVTQSCSTLPCWFKFDTGTSSGTVAPRVAGYVACDDSLADGCVAILPIAAHKNSSADTCTGTDPVESMCIVTWAAFQLRPGGQAGDPAGCNSSNCHMGKLLGNLILLEGTGYNWTPGATGPVVVRLLG